MFNIVKKSFTYGAHQVTLETGEIARQASGAVLVTMDDTVVLVTVVGAAYLAWRDTFGDGAAPPPPPEVHGFEA